MYSLAAWPHGPYPILAVPAPPCKDAPIQASPAPPCKDAPIQASPVGRGMPVVLDRTFGSLSAVVSHGQLQG